MPNLYSRMLRPGSATGRGRAVAVKAANRVLRRLPQRWPSVDYELDGFPLRLPVSHPLPRILATDPRYLRPLSDLARALSDAGVPGPAVDIGANVGDTAVVMALAGITDVVCVEGNDTFLEPLRRNAQRAESRGWHLSVVDRFVSDEAAGDGLELRTAGGTAALVDVGASAVDPARTGVRLISTTDLLSMAGSISLLKIDTDGMDVRLLRAVLAAPVECTVHAAFVEYTPALESLLDVTAALAEAGLDRLHWFDHRGHHVCSTGTKDDELVRDLSRYGRERGTYFDIAAVRSSTPYATAFVASLDAST